MKDQISGALLIPTRERRTLLPGWGAKTLILILLGFAATDFVITMTLSAADAAQHAMENPYLHSHLADLPDERLTPPLAFSSGRRIYCPQIMLGG